MNASLKSSKNRTRDKKSIINDRYANIIMYAFMFLISAFIIVVPFYRGLYFRENYIPAIIYISAIFTLYILFKFVKRDFNFFNSYMDIAVFLLPIAYLISFFFAANAKDAFDAVLKYFSYFMIYKIVADLCKNDRKAKLFTNAILLSIFIMALASLLTAFGYLQLKGVVIDKTIYGLYQYTNATASVLGAGMILGLGLLFESRKLVENICYQLILTTLFSVFVLTLSRGAFIVFMFILVIYFATINAPRRAGLLINIVIMVISSTPLIYEYYKNDLSKLMLIYYILAILVSILFQLVYFVIKNKWLDRFEEKSINIVTIAIILIAVIAAISIYNIRVPLEYRIEHVGSEDASWKNRAISINDIEPNTDYVLQFKVSSSSENSHSYEVVVNSINQNGEQTKILDKFEPVGRNFTLKKFDIMTLEDTQELIISMYNYEAKSFTVYKDIKLLSKDNKVIKSFEKIKYLPEAIGNRLLDMNLQTENALSRIYFTKDGLKLFKDNFLIGTGGGGWQNLYTKYQSFYYSTTEAHNLYVQIMVETGIIGILILFGIIVFILKGFYNNVLKLKKYDLIALYMGIFMILGHAALDFDLSLGALAFLMWGLIGLLSSGTEKRSLEQHKQSYLKYIAIVITLTVLWQSSSIYNGMINGNRASSIVNTDEKRAIALYESAMKLDKYNAAYRMDYAQIMNKTYQETKQKQYLDKMNKNIDKILRYEPYNARYTSIILNLLLSNGELPKAVSICNKLVEVRPMDVSAYMIKLNVNYEIAKYFFSNKHQEEGIPYLNNMLEVEKQLENAKSKSVRPLSIDKKVYDMIGLANNWIENANKLNK